MISLRAYGYECNLLPQTFAPSPGPKVPISVPRRPAAPTQKGPRCGQRGGLLVHSELIDLRSTSTQGHLNIRQHFETEGKTLLGQRGRDLSLSKDFPLSLTNQPACAA